MGPAEVFLLSFIGVALFYCISFFIIFSSTYAAVSSFFTSVKPGRHIDALQKNILSAQMIFNPSFLQLQKMSLSQKTGKGGICHA